MKTVGIAYFDCFSGISGDMVLGALVDAGTDLQQIEHELRKLKLEGWAIGAQKVQKRAIFATYVKVEANEHHHHRGLSVILGMIDEAGLAPRAAERAKAPQTESRSRQSTPAPSLSLGLEIKQSTEDR